MILKDVTATVSTRNRTKATLPLVITSVAIANIKPAKIIVYDDNDVFEDPRNDEVMKNLLDLLLREGIMWHWNPGEKRGQIHNHQKALKEVDTEFIWRLDDDNIIPCNVLSELYTTIKSDSTIGAVGPSIIDPKNQVYTSLASNKIEDIYLGLNEQWNYKTEIEIKDVDHLQGSTFLFRKAAALHGYDLNLSRVGHREETIFTYEMKKAGWKLKAITGLNTWHLRYGSGGIRNFNDIKLFQSDDAVFAKKIAEWKINPKEYKFFYLDSGRGDHYAFKRLLPELKKKYKNHKLIIGACFRDCFWDINDENIIVTTMSEVAPFVKADDHNVYRFMDMKNWKHSLVAAFREIYL